jgi:transcriptional regulator with PAS, ATPase and Fis domain
VRTQIARIAATDCNVLITGETGTGKELAAELIHENSSRRHERFLCVNCAAIPEALFESELFGYERGAFTGAHSTRRGQLELADKGVLFLDEIGEMNLHAQAKILRAIEGKEVQRLGRQTGIKSDVRIVCATNRDLESEVEKGTFRADLFFRLNVAQLKLPPLRDRKEDLHELGEHFFHELNAKMGLSVRDFTGHSWRSLLRHSWPGNVREFKNVVEASLVRLPYPRMRLAELPQEFHRQFDGFESTPTESEKLLAALVSHNWNKSKAAQELRWSRMTLYRKMAKYQLASAGQHGAKTA